jgi:hypothetical protein
MRMSSYRVGVEIFIILLIKQFFCSFAELYVIKSEQIFWCLDVASTHSPSTRSIYFSSRRSYRPAESRVEAQRRQRPGPPPATTNRLLAEPDGGPWVNCAWVEVSRGRFVGGRIIKAPIFLHPGLGLLRWGMYWHIWAGLSISCVVCSPLLFTLTAKTYIFCG